MLGEGLCWPRTCVPACIATATTHTSRVHSESLCPPSLAMPGSDPGQIEAKEQNVPANQCERRLAETPCASEQVLRWPDQSKTAFKQCWNRSHYRAAADF